jgi:2-polyprenyl-3-methyl-5-hydroxy-6-metoxy-1,4-benzoquinol methylase
MQSSITQSGNTTVLNTINPKDISEKYRNAMGVDVGDEFRSLSTIEFWQCNDTGFRWYEPAKAAGGGELYRQLEKFDWYYMPEKWEFSAARNLISKEDRVLEVGVGFGFFLEACRSDGIGISGVELNPSAAKRAREKGFEIFEENLGDLAERIGKDHFDVICSFQVLEHVSKPREFLEGMLRNLKVGGRLILSVPNAAVMRRIDPNNQDLLNQPPHHMGHWDENVFRSLQTVLPVRLRSVHREPLASYHVAWMVNSYLRKFLSPLGKTLPRLLINRYSTLPLQWILKAGLRKFLPGHTLLVELEKLG